MWRRTLLAKAGVVVAVLLLLSTLSPALGSAGYERVESVKLGLLAVKESNGNVEGEVIPSNLLLLWPGAGRVEVVNGGGVGNSTLYSTAEAMLVASLLAGVNPLSYDVKLTFETNERVSGPSASGFISSAILLLLQGLYPSSSATMTGMISATGFILPVSGVRYKVEAAAEKGYKLILVPLPNYEKKLAAYKGIRVEPVCSVEEAASTLSNATLLPPNYLNVSAAWSMVKDKLALFNSYASIFRNATLKLAQLLPGNTSRLLSSLVNLSIAVGRVDPYASASIAFMAAYLASTAAAKVKGLKVVEQAFNTTLPGILSLARENVEKAAASFEKRSLCGLWGLEALEAAMLRLYFAEKAASQQDPTYKALAILRAVSAISWAQLANPSWGPLVNCSVIPSAAKLAVRYMDTTFKYMESIMGRYINITVMPYGGRLAGWVSDAIEAYERGNYTFALALSMYIVGDIEERLVESIPLPANCVVERFERVVAATLVHGLPSLRALLALGYISHAGSQLERLTGDKMLMVGLAVSGIIWSLHSTVVGVAGGEPANTTIVSGGVAASAAHAQRSWPLLRCLVVVVVTSVSLGLASYIAYSLSVRLRGEEV